MLIRSVWLLHYKAAMGPESYMNYDGSSFLLAVGVVPAVTMKEALSLFDADLAKNKMSMLELWRCEQWNPKNYDSNSFAGQEINQYSEQALETNVIYSVCGISSEALDCEGSEHDYIVQSYAHR
ncbi:MAG TPA: hypothetical protein VN030_03615 [Cellvibrio sp.]|nr:hypothetical protein [Cellvibrio sp.]